MVMLNYFYCKELLSPHEYCHTPHRSPTLDRRDSVKSIDIASCLNDTC